MINTGKHRRIALALSLILFVASALSSCIPEYHITGEPFTPEEKPVYTRKDYRLDTSARVLESNVGRYLFDNLLDYCPPGVVTVNNSDYRVSDEILTKMFGDLEAYSFMSGFYAIDLETYMSVGYNAGEKFFTASTVKAGFALYCFKQIEAGNGSYDDTMAFRQRHHSDKSSPISKGYDDEDYDYGKEYTIRYLLREMIRVSDNSAYYMLLDYFGTDGYNQMTAEMGIDHQITFDSSVSLGKWGYYTPHDLGIIWKAIYEYRDDSPEGEQLWEYLTTNCYNEIAEALPQYETIAHKSGWGDKKGDCNGGFHDAGVVICDHDYVVVVMTDTKYNTDCFDELVIIVDRIMSEYRAWLDTQRTWN